MRHFDGLETAATRKRTFPYAGNAVRYLDGLKAAATRKRSFPYAGNAVGDNRRLAPQYQLCSILRQQTIVLGHKVSIILRHFDGLETAATIKRTSPYARNAVGYLDRLKAAATRKCTTPYAGNAVRYLDGLETAATRKRISPYAGNAVGDNRCLAPQYQLWFHP